MRLVPIEYSFRFDGVLHLDNDVDVFATSVVTSSIEIRSF